MTNDHPDYRTYPVCRKHVLPTLRANRKFPVQILYRVYGALNCSGLVQDTSSREVWYIFDCGGELEELHRLEGLSDSQLRQEALREIRYQLPYYRDYNCG